MQAVAMEMNLSETAFVHPRDDGSWSLRWFTPAVEVDLCGHATLAAAHALFSEGLGEGEETIRFETRSGLLTATRDGEMIELDFPARPEQQADAPEGLLESLGVPNPLYVGRNVWDYLVEVDSPATVRALTPDFTRLRRIRVRGVIVTARGEGDYDFISRFFAPGSGIDEDPVTGSAHCCLAPYWAPKLGKDDFRAYQASARGGELRVRIDGDRVKLGGRAVTILRADLAV